MKPIRASNLLGWTLSRAITKIKNKTGRVTEWVSWTIWVGNLPKYLLVKWVQAGCCEATPWVKSLYWEGLGAMYLWSPTPVRCQGAAPPPALWQHCPEEHGNTVTACSYLGATGPDILDAQALYCPHSSRMCSGPASRLLQCFSEEITSF